MITKQPYEQKEIIIIDNGSTDKSIKIAKQYGAKIYKDNSPFSDLLYDKAIEKATELCDFEINQEHKALTTQILKDYKHMNTGSMAENIIKAGHLRGFLG